MKRVRINDCTDAILQEDFGDYVLLSVEEYNAIVLQLKLIKGVLFWIRTAETNKGMC